MKFFFLYFIIFFTFSLNAQKSDLLILDGVKYKGRLIEYLDYDIKNTNSGNVIFYLNNLNDTLKINFSRNFKLKINSSDKSKIYYNFTKKTWNNIELGLLFNRDSYTNVSLYLSKGLVNKKLYNLGVGTGILTIDLINFIPFYLQNSRDLYSIGRHSNFKLFLENRIGYSIGRDLGSEDYILTEGGFYWNPSFGIKKSSGKKHIAFKVGYLLQNYSSQHNNMWGWWAIPDILFGTNTIDDIISRDGSFKRMTFSFSLFF